MKVDMVCGSYPPDVCGVADYTRLLAGKLLDRGVDVRIVTTQGRDAAADPDVPAAPIAPDWTIGGARVLARQLRERGAEIVHIQFPTGPYHGHLGVNVLPMLLRSNRPGVVTTLHEYCMAPPGGRVKQLLNVWFSDEVIVTNDYDQDLLARWRRARPVRVIPIGSNIRPCGSADEGRAILRSAGAPDGSRALVYFGFARPGKGIETAVRALQALPEEVVLIIASGDPSAVYRDSLAHMSEELGVSGRIIWTGFQDERGVSSILSASDVAVLPFEDGASFRRGTLLAALEHGLPVVTTRSSRTPAGLVHGRNALLAAPGDAASTAGLVTDVLGSPDFARTLSEGAVALAQQFSWDTIADRTVEVYSKVLTGGTS